MSAAVPERRVAKCVCGQLTATTHGTPRRVTVCHCLACQARTGSTYGVQASFAPVQVELDGARTTFLRVGDEGSRIEYSFCPRCGSTVWYTIEGREVVAIPVGTFGDPHFAPPTVSIYEARMHDWVVMPAAIEHLD